ncbi:MAG: Uma2 family endonuclease [Natronosporangium sp.]
MKLLEERSGRLYNVDERWTLEDYLALPDDTRLEIAEGVLRPMARSYTEGRQAQRRLTNVLETLCPTEFQVELEEIVVLHEVPPEARIPDITVFSRAGKVRRTNHVAARHVVLVVEVVSPGSGDLDRWVKPGEYARNGIPHFWRIELEPEIAVHTYVLTDGQYVNAGVFGPGDRITSVVLGWVDIPVDQLLAAR